MQFAKLYHVKNHATGESVQVLYQRLQQNIVAQDGSSKMFYLLVSTIENENDVDVRSIMLDTREQLDAAFDLIDEYRAEALINPIH